jgi:hypothetical protein
MFFQQIVVTFAGSISENQSALWYMGKSEDKWLYKPYSDGNRCVRKHPSTKEDSLVRNVLGIAMTLVIILVERKERYPLPPDWELWVHCIMCVTSFTCFETSSKRVGN